MLRTILTYGIAAGLLVAVPMFAMMALADPNKIGSSHFAGYTVMLLALSLIFIGVKRLRDRTLGGVIRFVPALLAGLGISAVAGVLYVIGWEMTLALTDFDFINTYANAQTEAARARGASAAELDKIAADMARFRTDYANPLIRLPMTFVEIFPVGLLVSLVSAGLLRNSRFMPARG